MKTNVLKASQPHKSKVGNRKSESIRIASRRNKSGGVLIGLIIAMVVVGILSAAMVKMLQGQAVTSTKAYNVMRARYAAESGYSYLKTLSFEAQTNLTEHASTFTLPNGDVFTIDATTNTTHLLATINGKMISGNSEVIATRPLKVQVALGGGSGGGGPGTGEGEPTTPGDELIDDTLIDLIPDPTEDKNNLDLDKVDKDFAPDKPNGKDHKKDIEKVYEAVLLSHDVFRNELINTPYGESVKFRTDLDFRHAEVEFEGGTKTEDKHLIWDVMLPLNYANQANASAAGGYLSYDAQAKISWEEQNRSFYSAYSRIYGAQGIAFKVHGSEEQGFNYYAVTLMRYVDATEKGNGFDSYEDLLTPDWQTGLGLPGNNNNDGYWGTVDGISNRIKPPNKNNKYLLVLWKETASQVKAGKKDFEIQKTRTWIASRDVDASYLSSSKYVLDVGIHLRVQEGKDEQGEYFDVVMGMSDGGNPGRTRYPGNTSPYDQGWNAPRRSYWNSSDLPDSFDTIFPSWIPGDISTWNATVDYFTLLGLDYTQINTSVSDVSFLADKTTLRVYDQNFLYKNQSEPMGELGFVFCGNFMSGMQHELWDDKGKLINKDKPDKWTEAEIKAADLPSLYMAVDDFSVFWGGSDLPSTGTDIPDIITDF